MLPLVEFSINNAVHASTGFTPFFVNQLRNPRIPLTLVGQPSEGSTGRQSFERLLASVTPVGVKKQVQHVLATRVAIMQRVRDAMADAQDKQKEQADRQEEATKTSMMWVTWCYLTLKTYRSTKSPLSARQSYVLATSAPTR